MDNMHARSGSHGVRPQLAQAVERLLQQEDVRAARLQALRGGCLPLGADARQGLHGRERRVAEQARPLIRGDVLKAVKRREVVAGGVHVRLNRLRVAVFGGLRSSSSSV